MNRLPFFLYPPSEEPSSMCCHACKKERERELKAEKGHMVIICAGMIVCPDCGNKRCPKAANHRYPCTGSNEQGQVGGVY